MRILGVNIFYCPEKTLRVKKEFAASNMPEKAGKVRCYEIITDLFRKHAFAFSISGYLWLCLRAVLRYWRLRFTYACQQEKV